MTDADVQRLWLGDDGRVHIRRDVVIEPGHVQIGERPTVEEIRRTVDPILHAYRQGQANVGNRIQNGETTPMSGWKVAGIILFPALLAAIVGAVVYPTETRNLVGTVWARMVSATCIPPAPYATFDGIHESGDSEWKVPVDTCPD